MSKIYRYGYKLIPLYFAVLGMLCVGLYWVAYPLFDYAWLNSYLSDSPQYLSFYTNKNYNVANLFTGFLLIFLVGIHFTLIIGGILSIYWSEFIGLNMRKKGFNLIEIFVNIPFVVYGYVLLVVFTKLTDLQGNVFQNMIVSSLILGGMMLPNIIYKFIQILQSIPYDQREGVYSLGASRYRTAIMVLIPAQTKLFVAAVITITSRAFGEILIVLLVAGFTTERLEVIASIFIILIISTAISQWLKRSHNQDGTI